MSDSMITCPACGHPMPAGGRFCINCGHLIESPVEPTTTETEHTLLEATETGTPSESAVMGADTDVSEEGPATVPGAIKSTQGADISDGSATPNDDLPGQPGSVLQPETSSPAPPESWYVSLASSPGEVSPVSDDSSTSATESTPDSASQNEPEAQSMSVSAPETTAPTFTPPVYSPPPLSSHWQPGAYDMGATQPVDIPVSGQAASAPPTGAAPGRPRSIFSPPPPPPAPAQGQYTQPMTPQQGYSPPPQQTFTPPPGYDNQSLAPGGTQPLQPGQSYPNYQPYPPVYPVPQPAAAPKDPTTALMLELLGYLGFLGIGHIYAGKTNRGIGLLIGWLIYLTASFVLSFCLVGCFMFLAWVVVPPLSGIWVKNEMEKERIAGFRQ